MRKWISKDHTCPNCRESVDSEKTEEAPKYVNPKKYLEIEKAFNKIQVKCITSIFMPSILYSRLNFRTPRGYANQAVSWYFLIM